MYSCWKWSTVIFVLQLVVGGGVYFFTGDPATTTATVALALAIALYTATITAAAIAAIAFAVAVILTPFPAIAAVVVAIAIVAVAVAKEENEPFLAHFVAALPLGIGTVLGGTILLLRQRKQMGEWLRKKTAFS